MAPRRAAAVAAAVVLGAAMLLAGKRGSIQDLPGRLNEWQLGTGSVTAVTECDAVGVTPGWLVSIEWVDGTGQKFNDTLGECTAQQYRYGDPVGVRRSGDTLEVGPIRETAALLGDLRSTRTTLQFQTVTAVTAMSALSAVIWTFAAPMRGRPPPPAATRVTYGQVTVPKLRRRGAPKGPLPDPGWYPDPLNVGQLRYFNGDNWTTHTHR